MWRRTSESGPPPSSSEPTTPAPPPAFERPAPVPAAELRSAESLLGRGLTMKGELSSREDVSIDGEFEGHIRVSGAGVTVGASGRVTAEIEADEIFVDGQVQGGLRARERVVIRRTGRVVGDITAKRLAIEDGAILRGSVETVRPGEARAAQPVVAARVERQTFRRVPVEASEPVR